MILIDILQKYIHNARIPRYLDVVTISTTEERELKDLVVLLTSKNIWTLEDLKKALK